MTADQVRYCAEDIVNTDNQLIYNMTLDELNLCMEKGVKGEYGEIYNRMDQAIVFKWIQSYIDAKLIVGEKLRGQQDGDMRQNIHEIFQTETMHTILTDVVSKLVIKEEKKPEPVRVVTTSQWIINGWMRDFDEIFENEAKDTGPVRSVEIDGTWMDMKQYLDYRLKEYNENK